MNVATRRVVLTHTAGPFKGLRQIVGTIEHAGELPTALEDIGIWPDWRPARAVQTRVTARAVFFREEPWNQLAMDFSEPEGEAA